MLSQTLMKKIRKKICNIKKNINEIGFENTANIYSNSNTAKMRSGGLLMSFN